MNSVQTSSDTVYISEEDYLEGEKISDVRHEYCNGKVEAMAGSSKQHNRIAGNMYIALSLMSCNLPCEIYSSDLKVKVASRNSYYYPDVVASCDEDDNSDNYCVEKPCLIIEVLSKSTAQKDYCEKLLAYQTLSSLQNYLIIAQDKCHIDLFYREEQGWWFKTFTQLEERIAFSCPAGEITVKEIYAGIEFKS
jgi:Uma2 family endonuclease